MEILMEGDVVEYVDPKGVGRPALITAVWRAPEQQDDDFSVNLVFVSGDPARTDGYGRQLERDSSVVNEASQYAPGNFWRRLK